MMVDTLTIARELRAADLPTGQAEAIAAAIGRSITESSATKADVETARLMMKGDLDGAKQELRTEIERLRTEMERANNRLLVWLMSAMVTLGGIIIAVVKL